MSGAWTRMGTVKSVNPARRELRVDPTRAFEKATGVTQIRIASPSGPMTCAVEDVNATPAGLIVRLGAGVSRDAVAQMKGAAVEAARPKRRHSAPDEMDAAEWIGLEVVGVDGTRIGIISGCIESRAHNILEIDAPDGRQLLLPAIKQTVESIDLETRYVTVGDIAPYVLDNAD